MENNLDKLFKSKLGGQEPEFDPAAWDRMEGILDAAGMNPAPKKKSNRNRFFYLSLLFIGISVSIIGYISLIPSNTSGEGSTLVNNTKQSKTNSVKQTKNSNSTSNTSIQNLQTKGSHSDQEINRGSIQEASIQEATIQKDLNTKEIDFVGDLKKQESIESNKVKKEIRNNELKNTFKYTQTKAQFKDSEVKNNNQNLFPENLLIAKNNLSEIDKSNKIDEHPAETKINAKTDATLTSRSTATESDIKENALNGSNSKELHLFPDFLNTRTGTLNTIPSFSLPSIVTPSIQTLKSSSVFTMGIMASSRFSGGLGFSVGPYVTYDIGKGVAVNVGGQFDSQNFDSGPEISVIDKIYSFGSRLSERKFSLANQKSFRIPVSISKSFRGFSISTGVILNNVFASEGSISESAETGIEENAILDSDLINPMTISLQVGGSVGVSRHFALDFGIEFRPKAFVDDLSTSNNINKYYPTVGLRYKLFKF